MELYYTGFLGRKSVYKNTFSLTTLVVLLVWQYSFYFIPTRVSRIIGQALTKIERVWKIQSLHNLTDRNLSL